MATQSIPTYQAPVRPARVLRVLAWTGWTKVFGSVAIGAAGYTGARAAIDRAPLVNYPWEMAGFALAAVVWTGSKFVSAFFDVALDRDQAQQ